MAEVLFQHFIRSGAKNLRCGYTTGTCAALAAAAATRLLLTGHAPATETLLTPAGLEVTAPVQALPDGKGFALCQVEKYAGGDTDATNGLPIQARVARTEGNAVTLDGGEGVGRVTLPGLEQPVGAAAINQVPRRMIAESVRAAAKEAGYTGGLAVTICVPGGAEAAAHTFNPRLGIEGGISILGTSGIVEPQSLAALVDTIEVECRQKAAAGANTLVLTPGHYGEDFLAAHPVPWPVVTCSNFIGDALDICASLGFERVLLVGHVGKLCKLAAGVMNTHSRTADARAEVFVTHAALAGAPLPLLQALMEAPTTDGCLDLLDQAGLTAPVLHGMLARMGFYLTRRAAGKFTVGAAMFSQSRGLLGCTPGLQENFKEWNPDE